MISTKDPSSGYHGVSNLVARGIIPLIPRWLQCPNHKEIDYLGTCLQVQHNNPESEMQQRLQYRKLRLPAELQADKFQDQDCRRRREDEDEDTV